MNILIIDDNSDLVQALCLGFELQWAECHAIAAESGAKGMAAFERERPDIVLLDINMPKMDGFLVLQRIREISDTPVIMLSVRSEEMEKVRALELGADDYVTKPFGSLELMARVKALMRRAAVPLPAAATAPFMSDSLTINYSSSVVTVRGRQVKLTPTEYRLLCTLARHPNQVLSHQALLVRVWGGEYRGETDFLKVYIKRLRDKIEEDPSKPAYIITDWGRGYKLATQ